MAADQEIPNIPDYHTKLIHPTDVGALQALLERCDDFFILVDGAPPHSNAASALLQEYPPGKTADEKLVIGIYNPDDEMVAVLDAIRDYPAAGAWWLGLLLLDPPYRNQGLGRDVYQAFENWVIDQEGKGICLGVIEENTQAFKFWQSMGFKEYERQPARQFGALEHRVITMVRRLPEDTHARD
jgi:GNAT superfamily N-acetyltransferase